jgi:N-acetylmuramoyl-L-alanine amidase
MTSKSRSNSRRADNMAVRRKQKSNASRSQVGWLILIAIAGTIGLAVITTARVGGLPVQPIATPRPAASLTPTPLSFSAPQPDGRPRRPIIGIVAGHWGNDSGSVCPDGVTEQQTNLEIAKRVAEILTARDYRVDLLQEFDSRLNGYQADMLLSIHADSCDAIDADPPATGFKVARSAASAIPNTEDNLVTCLKDNYARVTELPYHENSITHDMTDYHSFREVNLDTPAAIIETGFLKLDYNLIVNQPDIPARGIADGITCFINSLPK